MNAKQLQEYLESIMISKKFLDKIKGKSLEEWWETCTDANLMRWFLVMVRDTPMSDDFWLSRKEANEVFNYYDKHGPKEFLKWVRENYELVDWE